MMRQTQTLTFPIHSASTTPRPATDWHRRWKFEADAFTHALGPRQGVFKIELSHDTGAVTVEYDPERFSLDQLKALGKELGLIVGGAVYHTVLDLPKCGRRAALAIELQNQLGQIPGVARAAVNPAGRTLTVEYIVTAAAAPASIADHLQQLGYRVRDLRLPPGWWERNQLAVYTVICLLTLIPAWALEHVFHASWLVYVPLYVIAYLAGGTTAAINGAKALWERQIDVDFLMVAAALGAAAIGDWAEGGTLLFLFSLSNAMQEYALDRTRQAIRALMDLRPATARLMREGHEQTVKVEDLIIGDVVEVRPGERLPADGEITAGDSAIDQSPITGESIPVEKRVGDRVFAGSINGGGALSVRVTRRAADSTLARIILLVEEAQSERAPTQKRLDAFEQKYAVGVVSMTILATLIPPFVLGWAWDVAFYRAIALMVVASPCALVISTPASILSAIAAGARHGVLFKGGAHVESLAGIKVIAFDKTGTLTVGKPQVTDVLAHGITDNELLTLAASVESKSEHPLARAVVEAAKQRGLRWPEALNLKATAGKGVTAQVEGRAIHIGTPDHLWAQGLALTEADVQQATALEEHGKTAMFVGTDRLLGVIAVADTVRPEARAAVAALKALGIQKTVMLTGDNARAARAIGESAGVDEVRAELLPEDKVTVIKQLLKDYGQVAMVGDGVNDAPALASATVGIAMGAGGTDAALETADVVLMSSDLSKLPYALGLGRRGMQVVKQNLTFAMGVIAVLIISNLVSSATGQNFPLPLGVVGHEGSTVIVVLNGLRLLAYRPPQTLMPPVGLQ
jgi:Cd2+/Zn2+-exporting ATPase